MCSAIVNRARGGVLRSLGGLGVAAGVVLAAVPAQAQLTATNAVALIEDNVTNARDTLVPLAIGGAVLFVAIAAGMKFWKRIFR